MTRREKDLVIELARLHSLLLDLHPHIRVDRSLPGALELEDRLEQAVMGDDYRERMERAYRARHGSAASDAVECSPAGGGGVSPAITVWCGGDSKVH